MDNGTSTVEIDFRPRTDTDSEFLYTVYASTRIEEMVVTDWTPEQIDAFLRMQFQLQHTHYCQNYAQAMFEVILIDGVPAGRLYVDRQKNKIVVIEISLLPEFRQRGIGGSILRTLVQEADQDGLSMSLHVERNNPILSFYTQLGFCKKDEYGIYYYMERAASAGVIL